jgi:hypothetical protein
MYIADSKTTYKFNTENEPTSEIKKVESASQSGSEISSKFGRMKQVDF